MTAGLFLFPSNKFLPIDRRLAGLGGAACCVVFTWIFDVEIEPTPNDSETEDKLPLTFNTHHIDVVVLVILTAIMVINFVIMRQEEIVKGIAYIQNIIRTDVNAGYWFVCIVAFLASPFITNDGLCLLIVDPVLDAFLMTHDPRKPVVDLSSARRESMCTPKEEKTFFTSIQAFFASNKAPDSRHGSDASVNGNNTPTKESLTGKIGSSSSMGGPISATSDKSFSKNGRTSMLDVAPTLAALIPFASSKANDVTVELKRVDHLSNRFFYMLGIACSANIGSAMTFTGNPQNIIIAEHLGHLMSGGMFFALMIPPAFLSWYITIGYLNRVRVMCVEMEPRKPRAGGDNDKATNNNPLLAESFNNDSPNSIVDLEGSGPVELFPETEEAVNERSTEAISSKVAEQIGHQSWVAFPLFLVLIILELVGFLPLVALFALVAIYMIICVVLVNYYSNYPKRWPDGKDMTPGDRIKLITRYIEDMFNDLDYNLLIIFTGLFIVAGSFVDTGVPALLWKGVAGSNDTAFKTGSSIFLISLYTTIASQLIGNVAVILMAADNILELDDNTQRFGWLLMAWVSTVAGNFTLAGSAANIIVAEKAMRHGMKGARGGGHEESASTPPPFSEYRTSKMPLPPLADGLKGFRNQTIVESMNIPPAPVTKSARTKISTVYHFKHCGLVTVISIIIGTVILYLESKTAGFI